MNSHPLPIALPADGCLASDRPPGLGQPPTPPKLAARWLTIASDLAGLRGMLDYAERGLALRHFLPPNARRERAALGHLMYGRLSAAIALTVIHDAVDLAEEFRRMERMLEVARALIDAP